MPGPRGDPGLLPLLMRAPAVPVESGLTERYGPVNGTLSPADAGPYDPGHAGPTRTEDAL